MTPFDNEPFHRQWNQGQFRDALNEPAKPDLSSNEEKLTAIFFGNRQERNVTAAITGLSMGDFLYDYLQIDPTVIEGVDFARSEELSSVFSFAQFSSNIDLESTGDISQMQGYVAEVLLAMELTEKGHEVSFPDTSNQAGWDLLVDGQPFQVKNLSDPSGIYSHLQTYPDIPVYVNADLAERFSDHDMVYASNNVHHEEVVAMTRDSLAAGQELTDFEIPLFTALVSTAVNVRHFMNKESDITHTIGNILTDTASRSAAGYAGQFAGAAAGSLLFGPAGVVVFSAGGAFAGVAQGGKLSALIKKQFAKEELIRYRKDLTVLIDRVSTEIPTKKERRNAKWLAMHKQLRLNDAPKDVMDDMHERYQERQQYLTDKQDTLQALKSDLLASPDPYRMFERTLGTIVQTGVHPVYYQTQLQSAKSSLQDLMEKLNKMRLQ